MDSDTDKESTGSLPELPDIAALLAQVMPGQALVPAEAQPANGLPESPEIVALLAQLMPRLEGAISLQEASEPPPPEFLGLPRPEPPPPRPSAPPLAGRPFGDLLAKTNWHNDPEFGKPPPPPPEPEPEPEPVAEPIAEVRPEPEPAREPADVFVLGGVRTADYFAAVNWRNVPELARRPGPVEPPPPPAEEPVRDVWSVTAVLATFVWEIQEP